MKRGEIYYIEASKQYQTTGSEQKPDRPAIIVSNNANNDNAQTVEVVFLTTQEKSPLPTHVTIRSANRISTALCEQINTVSIERIANYMGECSEEEMKQVDQALVASLGLELCPRAEIIDAERQAQEAKLKVTDLMLQCAEEKQNAMKIEVERDVIKSLFKSTIQEIISKQ